MPPPPPDRDGDGISDDVDACPDQPGKPNTDPRKNGCPEEKVVEVELRDLPPVQFRTGTAELTPASDSTLREIAAVLKQHPELRLRIEGHTDSVGTDQYNQGLAERRARAVRDRVIHFGGHPDQLVAAAFGRNRPVASNDTEAGRAKNRRVELHVERREGGAP